jgi:Rieske Fe-S protein
MIGCGDEKGERVTGDVDAGNVSALPVGSLRSVGSQAVAIGRDMACVYAMTLLCTHEQCNMAVDGNVSPGGISCSCHDSAFDPNGGVTSGPATQPLEHYQVMIDEGGQITIHADTVVSPDTRTAVPGAA